MTKIVAFLPNQTFPRDVQTEYLVKYMTDNIFRRRKLQVSYLGAWLLKIFGKETFNKIIWDNLIINIGEHSVNRCADEVIKYHNPNLILVFSNFGKASMQLLIDMGKVQCEVIDCTPLNMLSAHRPECLEILTQIKTKITELERR